MSLDLSTVGTVAELERAGIAYSWSNDTNVRCLCPFHELKGDHTPSCDVDTVKRVFKCRSCPADGDLVSLIARRLTLSRADVITDLSKRYTLTVAKTVDADVIERWHQALWHAPKLLEELRKRAVLDADIRLYRLGCDEDRITIPIRDDTGNFVDVLKYKPGAAHKKMTHLKGRGKDIFLFPPEQMRYDRIMICGGPIKAIVAAKQLNPHGIGAVSTTHGEGAWSPELTPKFAGKLPIVCLDIDKTGRSATQAICAILFKQCDKVEDLILPLDAKRFPKGDINDFVASGGDMPSILPSAKAWEPQATSIVIDGEPEAVDLSDAVLADRAGKRVKLNAVASAIGQVPFSVPRDVVITCDRAQRECGGCPVMLQDRTAFQIHPESLALLEMVDANLDAQRPAMMTALGVPLTCRSCEFSTTTFYNLQDLRFSPQLQITNRGVERTMMPAYLIGDNVDLNEAYHVTGRMLPHPKTQAATLLISSYEPAKDALSSYVATDTEKLRVFQPTDKNGNAEWSVDSLDAKLGEIYDDLSANVTRIYQRRLIHEFVDYAYHSPLFLTFDGQHGIKGWVEVLIIGDSSQGKSEVASRLMQHYDLGVKVDCKNATVAGLLGGLMHLGTKWMVAWGIIPTHDKRLVILEELKGAHTDTISRLTDMRSSGIAELPKIEKRKTFSRVRGIGLSNPRSKRPMKSHNFGVEAVVELVGSLEDVRRYDAILAVCEGEVEASVLNVSQENRPKRAHVYTSDLCHSLILWAWTRAENEVHFMPDAEAACLDEANRLCDKYTEAVPIVDRGSMRYKIARLAASIACRTFSASEDMQTVIVRACHVQYISRTLDQHYASDALGYAEFTTAARLGESLQDEQVLRKQLRDAPFAKDLCKQLQHTTSIELSDLQDWCGWGLAESKQLLSLLVRKHALTRDGRAYRKSAAFIKLLRDMLDKDEFVVMPDHVKQEF